MPGAEEEKKAVAISVESRDKENDDKKKDGGVAAMELEDETAAGDGVEESKAAAGGAGGKDADKLPEELSEEDQALKEGLELAVTRLKEDDTSLHKQALDHLVLEIKSATSSMTSVPKPLKFLRPHYDTLKAVYESWPLMHGMKRALADVMSVLAMTMALQGSRESLKFKLQGTQVNVSSWGHEYVRSLAGEVAEEYNQRLLDNEEEDEEDEALLNEDLMQLVDDIVPFQMHHNAEAEAVDLLIEVRKLNKLVEPAVDSLQPIVDERNYERVCLYLIRSADFVADPDELQTLFETAFTIYKQQRRFTDALRVAIKIASAEHIAQLFSVETGASTLEKKQMALILARDRNPFELDDNSSSNSSDSSSDSVSSEMLNELIGNCFLSEQFLGVARALDTSAPRLPEEVYKSGGRSSDAAAAVGGRGRAAAVDSARANLASTFVNGFVNAAYNTDKLLIDPVQESNSSNSSSNWLFKNKGHGMMSAAASLGMLMMWNVEEGLNQMDKYFHDSEDFVKAGACLGVGIISSGVRNESDPALALLSDYLDNSSGSNNSSSGASVNVRIGSICGLALAYAGARREEVKALLEDTISNTDSSANITEVSLAALAVGMCFVGTCDDDIGSVILQRLMEASEEELNHTTSRFMCLGLALLYLGKGEKVDAVLEAVRTIEHPRGKYAEVTLETCAYAGTGNVLKVQQMLRLCTDHLTEAAEHQAVAVLGIALTAVGEDIGTEMTLRTFEHLLHYGELPVKRVVPLALSLLYVSNPEYSIVDQLSRLSHDQDAELSQCAVLGLGLVSAGSNNSRVAGLLRSLAEFYAREANHLFVVRIAQGLNAMGKGLLTLSPFHSDRLLMSGPGMAGLLTLLHACIDMKGTVLDKFHYLLFFLAPAMNPRYLCLVDAALKPVDGGASVRVGQAVETVGQAGRPKTISGFQTHTSPVLLGYKDRAELAGREYVVAAATAVIEGVVIVQKAPEEGATDGSAAAESKS